MLRLAILYNETNGMMLTFGSFLFLFEIYSLLHYIFIYLFLFFCLPHVNSFKPSKDCTFL